MEKTPQREFRGWLRELGRAIARRRRELGLTQAQSAARCDLDFKYYQDVEYGRRPITTRTLFLLARSMETSVSVLATAADRAGYPRVLAAAETPPAYDATDGEATDPSRAPK